VVRVAAFKRRAHHDSWFDSVDEPMQRRACFLQRADESAVGKSQEMTTLDARKVHGAADFVFTGSIQSIVTARRHPRRMDDQASAHKQGQCPSDKDVIVRVRKYEKDYP
jgi:hypothetical protein